MRMKNSRNLKEQSTGIVHICNPNGSGEYTLCGLSFDEPSSERGEKCMVDSDDVCNCKECISAARKLIPVMRRELNRVAKKCREERE